MKSTIVALTALLFMVADSGAQTLEELKAMGDTECMDACVEKGLRSEACAGYTACAAMCENVCYPPIDYGHYYVTDGAPSDSLGKLLNPDGYCFERNHYMIVTTAGSRSQKGKEVLETGLRVAAIATNNRTARIGALAGSMVLDSFDLIPERPSLSRISLKNGTFEVKAEFVNGVALIEFFESNGWHYVSSTAAKMARNSCRSPNP